MNPAALEKSFEIYPEVRVIVVVHFYGTPGKIDEIKAIADANKVRKWFTQSRNNKSL